MGYVFLVAHYSECCRKYGDRLPGTDIGRLHPPSARLPKVDLQRRDGALADTLPLRLRVRPGS